MEQLKQLDKIKNLSAYEMIKGEYLSDLDSDGYILRHKKTGARVVLLSNEDNNKVFYIGFRTPPTDSTGVAHIIEHSVLCGSEKYPVKDPFIELAKGSLNTFLNAMTYPDKTVYPVASCNDQDFSNLVDVYLDAVFHPNIYHEEKIFKQEGWHYELESAESDLIINGVVYNEMKGAFSSPDDVVAREIFNNLFPDTSYGVESGGDPKVIPELTYENFLDFHSRYYHHSNSYIYLYGDLDMAEKLEYLDKEYLSKYDMLEIDSAVKKQKPFESTKYVSSSYPIAENESEKEHTYLVYSIAMDNNLDRDAYIAFEAIDYAICSAPGAPLKKALIDAGIGKDVYSEYDSGIMQPYFTITAKDTDIEKQEEFVNIVEKVLYEQANGGLDHVSVRASLNVSEFKYREADFGSYPRGLIVGLNAMDSWLYDDMQPFMHILANDTFAGLKDKIEDGYFEKLISDRLINNPHKIVLSVLPEKGLTTKTDNELAQKLKEYKESLSADEINKLVEETAELAKYQEAGDSEEALRCIPLLKREDLKKEAATFVNEEIIIGDTKALYHDIFTNGIAYIRFIFDMKNIPANYWVYLGALKSFMGLMDTENFSYMDLFNEMNLKTGGIAPATNTYIDDESRTDCTMTFEIKAKTLLDGIGDVVKLVREMAVGTDYSDKNRLLELVEETKSHIQSGMISAGHQLAVAEAAATISPIDATLNEMSGVPYLRLLEKISDDFDEEAPIVISKLNELTEMIFRPENLFIDYAGPKEGLSLLEEYLPELKKSLKTQPLTKNGGMVEPNFKKIGYTSASQVQYVARVGNYCEKGYEYNGALKALRVMMGYDYLWTNVRVRGGAYGCMCMFGQTGKSYFVSYRDPNLDRTVDVYENAAEYVRSFDADERTMTQYIIGAIADLDVPMTPSKKALYSLSAYMCNRKYESIQKERDELLNVTPEEIRKLADYIDAFMETGAYCVVGGEEKISESADTFDVIEPLFS